VTSAAGTGLEVADLTIRVGRPPLVLIERATFVAPAGKFTALLGPNGAGKSTLLRAIAGVEKPVSGSVRFDGDDILALPRRERARLVAISEQESVTELPLTVRAVVGLGRTPHESLLGGRDADAEAVIDHALETAGMTAFATRDIGTLSGGERQRVLFARALAQQPRLLLLDEPTNHLDVSAQLDMLDLVSGLAASGTTVVAALHDLTLAAAHADTVVVLLHGRVVAAGPTAETLTPELVREVYGIAARWIDNPLTGRKLLAVARL
jgi:iron complex transport system ATP-binding protein